MKFIHNITGTALTVPLSALKLCGFEHDEEIEVHARPGAAVILKHQMTTRELLYAADSLHQTADELTHQLTLAFGLCDGCDEVCSFEQERRSRISEETLDEMGISLPDHLCILEDEGDFLLAKKFCGLEDVPIGFMEFLDNSNLCLAQLAEHLNCGEVIYGG